MNDLDKLEASPELDARIAEKVTGWTLSKPCQDRGPYWAESNGKGTGWQVRAKLPWDWDWKYFNPSQDDASAWEVVEQLRQRGHMLVLMASNRGWTVEERGRFEVFAETMPLAVCRAAMMALVGKT